MIQNRLKNLILIGGDVILLYLALFATLTIRYGGFPSENIRDQHFLPFSILFIVWLVIFFINGLYDLATSNNDIAFYNRILTTLAIDFGAAAAYFYLLTDRLFSIKPQAVYFIFIGLVAVSFPLWRYWYNTFVQRPGMLRNVLIVGMNDEAKELIREIIKKPQLGYNIKAIMHAGLRKISDFPGVEIIKNSKDIQKLISEKKISTIVTAKDPHNNPEMVQQLFHTVIMKVQFFDLPTFYEKLTGKVPVTNIGHVWFLENLTESEMGVFQISKRLTDVLAAIFGLALSLPFIPLIALLIKIDSKGPVFFTQIRTGHLGKTFKAVKFRSMIEGAENNGPQWAQKQDPRATRIGKFLRRTRIDEIPQLLNVLAGEMAIIGPRPERPEFVKNLQKIIPFYNERHLVKPGLTGWAQINYQYGTSAADALKKLQYDLFYIKNRSLSLDIGIALKTIKIMLSGKGH